MTDTARLAVAGAGLIGRKHIELIRRLARLACIVDPAPDAKALADRLAVPWFASLPEALAQAAPDGIVLATPNQLHAEQGLACIAAGVPVLIEKPIAESTARAEPLVRAAEQADVPVLVGHHRRHNPLIDTVKTAIDRGDLGRLVTVQAQFWLYKPDDYFAPDWRRAAGAGPVFINLIHDIDLLRHLCGEVVEVQAMQSSAIRGFEVEDTAVCLLRFANGALGTVSVTDTAVAPWSWEFTTGENPAYPRIDTHCYLFGGTEGALSLPDRRIWRHEGARSWWAPMHATRLDVPQGDPLVRQLTHFLDVIAGRAAPLVSGREGLKSLALLERIKAAASRSGPPPLVSAAPPGDVGPT